MNANVSLQRITQLYCSTRNKRLYTHIAAHDSSASHLRVLDTGNFYSTRATALGAAH